LLEHRADNEEAEEEEQELVAAHLDAVRERDCDLPSAVNGDWAQ
jgi:hypothetical protein